MKKVLFLFVFGVLSAFVFAQTPFIKVNDDEVSLEEFKKMYQANIEVEGMQKSVDNYIEYTLLDQEAKQLQIDTLKVSKQVYYRVIPGIKEPYLEDETIKSELIDTEWKRLQTERNVEIYSWPVSNFYNIKAVNELKSKANHYREEICVNNNTSLKNEYAENNEFFSGYVRAFDLPLEEENAVYSTDTGNCSAVLKSDYNLFFVRVLDERPGRGTYKLSHILVSTKDSAQMVYNELEKGLNFGEAIEKYSNDKKTKNASGLLPEMSTDLPETFYAVLKNTVEKDYTQPIESEVGWHIFYVHSLNKYENKDDNMKWITTQLNKTGRGIKYHEQLIKEAKEKITCSENKAALKEIYKAIPSNLFSSDNKIEFNGDKVIWETPTAKFTQQNMVNEINATKEILNKGTNKDAFWDDAIPFFKDNWVVNQYKDNLAFYNPDFKAEDDLLKRAIRTNYYIEQHIYTPAEQDSIGQQKYLEKHTHNFTWPTRYDTEIFLCPSEKIANQVVKLLKSRKNANDILSQYKGKLTEDKKPYVHVTKGKLLADDNKIANINLKKKTQVVKEGKSYNVYHIKKVLPPTLMTRKEAGSLLLDSYKSQKYREKINKLKDKSAIWVDEKLIHD